MLLEIATAYAGELYGVNAFDQPGVELGKQFTYAMLGRPGFDAGAGGVRDAAGQPIRGGESRAARCGRVAAVPLPTSVPRAVRSPQPLPIPPAGPEI